MKVRVVERKAKSERERERTLHTSSLRRWPKWSGLTKSQKLHQGLPHGCRAQVFETPSAAFAGHQQGTEGTRLEVKYSGLRMEPPRLPALCVAASPTMPQCWANQSGLKEKNRLTSIHTELRNDHFFVLKYILENLE